MKFAPVILFVYKRPYHTRRTIESLLRNPELVKSPVFVYCDGARNQSEVDDVDATREVVLNLLPDATIIRRDENIGLANSIITGVTEQCDQFGKVIVLEDDLVLSKSALSYFNAALSYYEEDEQVMHISAYMFPVEEKLPPAFFYREATCWGWATWKRAWEHLEHDPNIIAEHINNHDLISQFNVNDTMYFWQMLQQQCKGNIDSWAIRWYGSIFLKNGLSLHPRLSLVQNKGFDGSGIHCNKTSEFEVKLSDNIPDFPSKIIESQDALQAMMKYRKLKHYRNSWKNRYKQTLKKCILKLCKYYE